MRNNTIAQLAGVIALSLACPAAAQEYDPFPRAQITAAQWNGYFDQVNTAHGQRKRDFPTEHLVVFDDHGSGEEKKAAEGRGDTFWSFTAPGHPAHPAWVTRQMVNNAGKLTMRQIGYFAGDEKAFAKLFQDYRALTDRLIKAAEEKMRPK
jgi:hypothetical protein